MARAAPGALIAVERRSRHVGALLRVLHDAKVPLKTTATVVAQVWRDGRTQVNLARLLAGVEVVDLTAVQAKRCGELLARAHTTDIVDANLALLVDDGDEVLTSDPGDIRHLLEAHPCAAAIVQV